jgi:hypothetical protein
MNSENYLGIIEDRVERLRLKCGRADERLMSVEVVGPGGLSVQAG